MNMKVAAFTVIEKSINTILLDIYIKIHCILNRSFPRRKKVSEYDQEISQSHTSDQPNPRNREEEPRKIKTNETSKRH